MSDIPACLPTAKWIVTPNPECTRAVIFDLDGTLYHMKWHMRPLLTLLLAPRILRLPCYINVRKEFVGKDMGSGSNLMVAMASRLASKAGTSDTDSVRRWIEYRFYPAFVRIMPMMRGARPGLATALRQLGSRGVKIAVVSDFAEVAPRLRGIGLEPTLFNEIRSTETEGCLKPGTRVFADLASRWGVAPENVLVVGDRADTDGAAASACGMMFLRITDRRPPRDGTLPWREVRSFLDRIPSPRSAM